MQSFPIKNWVPTFFFILQNRGILTFSKKKMEFDCKYELHRIQFLKGKGNTFKFWVKNLVKVINRTTIIYSVFLIVSYFQQFPSSILQHVGPPQKTQDEIKIRMIEKKKKKCVYITKRPKV